MRRASEKTSRRFECLPSIEMMVPGLLAILVVQGFRANGYRWLPGLWLETLFFLLVPILAMCVFLPKLTNLETEQAKKRVINWLCGGAGLMVGLSIAVQWFSRQVGLGDSYEIVALTTLLNVAWYLTVFSSFGGLGRAAFMLNVALVLFICFMSDQRSIFVLSFLFAISALWWLLGAYWSRINQKLLDGNSTTLPVNGMAIGGTLALVTVAGLIAWVLVPRQSSFNVTGFSFFSGGEQGFDDIFAQSGVGDGQMLTGGSNATTTGPVESDTFIEDDKPSIYDAMMDTFDGPIFKKKQLHRAVALEKQTKHLHDVVQSEMSGKSFRTVREPAETVDLKLEDRITKALFFVEGSVPARFTIDCFHQFDGWDWTKIKLESEDFVNPRISVKRGAKPWFVLQRIPRPYLSYRRAHRVKVMRLGTNTLPAPSLLESWHIHRVDDPSLFYWNEYGMIRMGGELIPPHTMIDMISRVPNYHVLRSDQNFQLNNHPSPAWEMVDRFLGVGTKSGTSAGKRHTGVHDSDSVMLQLPDNETTSRIISLAKSLTESKSPGWNQVEAIVNHLRSNFEHDDQRVPDPDCEDSVGEFLDNGGGPGYLFATTATQLLRAAGYRTRIASGFVVQDDDFDRRSNQSVVTKENVHMWPEVSLDGWHWIPVEPTPTYDIPFSHQTWWQWMKAQASSCIGWMWYHPLTTIITMLILATTIRFRRDIVAVVCWLGWTLAVFLMPNRRLKLTRQLIDARFWAAGLPRPKFVSTKNWSSQVDTAAGRDFFRFWWIENFSKQSSDSLSRYEVLTACRQIISDLSFIRIKAFAKTRPTREKS